MMLSGSGCHQLKPNSALMRQRLRLCLTLRSVSPTLKCPDSKCKLSSMQTAKHWGGCYSQMVMVLGKTRSSKIKSTGHQHSGLLWGRNKMGAFLISCHYNKPIFTPGAESPVSAIGWWHPKGYAFFSESPYEFYHYSLKSSRIFKTTTRAYKRTQNSIFSSRIASPFKKRNVIPPTDNSEDCTPRRTQPTHFNISFATHAY